MNLQKKKRVFLFLEVVLIGLTIGGIFYGRYQTVQRTEGKKVEQEKETSIERESRQAEQLPEQLPEPADTDLFGTLTKIAEVFHPDEKLPLLILNRRKVLLLF